MDYKLVGFSEIDKYAITAYCAIHNVDESMNLGDVSKIDTNDMPDCNLITYGFPCQDISIAGNQKGIIEGETRSGLLYEALRIIKDKKPKYAIAENVKNLVGKKFKDDFENLLDELDGYGYNNYWQVLNAKEYGIPQNRERVFIISTRKDIDDGKFEFPKPFDSGLRLKDMLENVVDEKYYINNDRVAGLLGELKEKDLLKRNGDGVAPSNIIQINDPNHFSQRVYSKDGIAPTISAGNNGGGKEPCKIICAERGRYNDDGVIEQQLEVQESGNSNTLTTVQKDNLLLEKTNGGIIDRYDNELKLFTNLEGGKWDKMQEVNRRVYEEDGISPTLTTMGGGHREPKVAVKEATKLGYAIATVGDSINIEQPNSKTRRGRVGKEVANTLTTSCNQATLEYNYKIRKLTPLECWRLMGFMDEDYYNAKKALENTYYNGGDRSNSQMYKMAGNSIVVDVLLAFYRSLFQNYIK